VFVAVNFERPHYVAGGFRFGIIHPSRPINFRYVDVMESLLNVSGRYFAIMLMSHWPMCVSSGFSTGQY
jgi:hypothetical protein